MTRLEFGRPVDSDQAFLRLPTNDHPLYGSDTAIEHLAHLCLTLYELQSLDLTPEQLRQICLDDRLVSLSLEDIQLMEKVSFRRNGLIALAQHEYIQSQNPWSLYLPSGDNGYRWWKVTDKEPDLRIAGTRFVCIESNRRYKHMHDTQWRSDSDSEFDIGLLLPDELDLLVTEITRWNR